MVHVLIDRQLSGKRVQCRSALVEHDMLSGFVRPAGGIAVAYEWAMENTKGINDITKKIMSREKAGWEFVHFGAQNDRLIMLFRRPQ